MGKTLASMIWWGLGREERAGSGERVHRQLHPLLLRNITNFFKTPLRERKRKAYFPQVIFSIVYFR